MVPGVCPWGNLHETRQESEVRGEGLEGPGEGGVALWRCARKTEALRPATAVNRCQRVLGVLDAGALGVGVREDRTRG